MLPLSATVFLALNILAILPLAWADSLVPRADTPLFYLVAASQSSPANLLPVRAAGGTITATLTGTGAPGQFYFDNSDVLRVVPPSTSDIPPHAFISSIPNSSGCTTYGTLAFVVGSSSNKCQRDGTFTLQSNNQNAQLGAQLVFQGAGGFYACGTDLTIWYEAKPGAGPPGLTCNSVQLYTVPVV